ncbi:MAG: flippase-like domain-containing protein [Anaerolineae bacterium]|nr:flippase-like domain-containing protein [Anaerolineae bacterium]
MRRTLVIIVSILVSAVFLVLALRDVPLAEVWSNIQQANPVWIIISLFSVLAGNWTRAVRWNGLLDFKIPHMQAVHMMNITFLLNQLPLRAGEVARSLLATRSGVPFVTAATSVVVERMIDTLFVVIVLTFAVSQLPTAPESITRIAGLFGIAVIVAFIVLIFFARYPGVGHKTLELVQRILPFLKRLPLAKLLDNVLEGLKPLTRWRSGVHAVVWSLISWAFSFFTFYCLQRALNIPELDPNVNPLLMSFLGVGLAAFSIAIPFTAAGIGPFELAVSEAGRAAGMQPNLATSLGFLFHGVNIIGYAIWGGISLLAMGVSLSELMNAPKEAPEGTS